MHKGKPLAWTIGLAPMLALVAGCGAGKTIELRYDRPPAYEISQSVRKLAVAEFGGQSLADRRWGDIASDQLASDLDAYNRKFQRYELVDRKRLKGIMDERDLQLAISDTASATKAGKIANVDAIIYGSVRVNTRDEHATKMVPDFAHPGSFKTVPYTKRYCMASVNFTMDDINTSKTLAAVTATREYDSDKDTQPGAAGLAKKLGFGGGSLPPADQVVNRLIQECVQEFLSKVSPHEQVVRERLAKGKSDAVDTGNKLAEASDYKGALEVYLQAIKEKPDDHGAMFNAGLMCEAAGDLKQAQDYYDRAFRLKPEEQYIRARQRVRTEAVRESP
jgi:tetratricopeptide (TPR) repeat protein